MGLRAKSVFSHLALVALGIVLALALSEGALQLGARYLSDSGRENLRSLVSGRTRILCVGDSNTYGLYLEPEFAYPEQLEALWNQVLDEPVEVVNFGYPGSNSSLILARLPDMLRKVSPDHVIVLAGLNDFWSQAFEATPAGEPRFSEKLYEASRLYRLAHLLHRRLQPVEIEIRAAQRRVGTHGEFRLGDAEFVLESSPMGLPGQRKTLDENLGSIAQVVRDYGADVSFLTYASNHLLYGAANSSIRKAATRFGVRLIELDPVFEAGCAGQTGAWGAALATSILPDPSGRPAVAADEACPELFFADQHPTALGYFAVAQTILRALHPEPTAALPGAAEIERESRRKVFPAD